MTNVQQQLLNDYPDPKVWETQHCWPCICGGNWFKCNRGTHRWRGRTGQIEPWQQFCRTILDPKLVIVDIDSLVRAYDKRNTFAVTIERCDFGKKPGRAKMETLRCMNEGMVWDNWIMVQDGNIPMAIEHYPVTHPWLGLPVAPVVSTKIEILKAGGDEWLTFDGEDKIRDEFVGRLLTREFIMLVGACEKYGYTATNR